MASVTIKNIPEELYAKLKAQARRNHRSINGEVLHCLEDAVRPKPWALSKEQKLALLRQGRVKIDPDKMPTPEQIKAAIEEGRE